MRYIVEVTYEVIDKDCKIHGLAVEEEDYKFIVLDRGLCSWDAANEDFQCSMQEYLNNLLDKDLLEYNVLYRTVMSVELTFTKDYYGEVDVDYELQLLHHGTDELYEGVGVNIECDPIPVPIKFIHKE